MSKDNSNETGSLLYFIVCTCTAMVGHTMHKSLFWAIFDFIFTPLVWFKWIVCKEVTLEIIKKTFDWFM